ncbi:MULTISPECIES: type IA DNA topoisomerase [Clostridium]|uniref:DNA topoisomerase n=1 Tax=Clostridium botulinum (strain Eklund 17B / Type B) TaxID=935198 RepID=B2TNL7_CLOBB|nr:MULTISPECIES: type IA DNA topoisomerase [Clostridium]ACD22284.1 DNA topoisomerase [Clostridium botulinum B str. Eklund 17B (NRP)]MBN1046084.1 type IA DNA topoisomerase [Clostridium botulinum]MBN1052874.1 type IA DNA topoisomerase [Clostridium botulinum]MBN1056038.1 type IA DNA topoisomerase [Clostridium botulinum]MBY6976146.1 type IA DNA topoisomerase [Clostridium botulinum]
MAKVIIAEKPSVAKNIADALNIKTRKDGYFKGEEYYITWAFGHLLQLYDAKDYDENMKGWRMEKFPFIPESFQYKVKCDNIDRTVEDKGAAKQINIIKSLIEQEDVDGVISATDFDREGQVIADELFNYLNIQKPIYRLLLNEWTPDEVKKGMGSLKENKEMQFLQDAGIGRQWTDWIIGINLTSVSTLKYKFEENKTINIGRVLLPTLKIIYDRDKEIENFEATTYYKLTSTFKNSSNEEFDGLYYEKESEKFEDKSVLDNLVKLLDGTNATIIDKQTEKKKDYPPYLFNLSNLQGYITSKYKGWTSDKVLKVAQSLYEKKYTTYPRTASVVLEESLEDRARKVLNTLKIGLPYEKDIKFIKTKRVFDNSKVESHSAITPTYIKPNGLSKDEEIVYNAIKNRFIMQFMPIAEFEETKIRLKPSNEEIQGEFISKGKVQLVEGWRVVEKIDTKDTILPMVNVDEKVDIVSNKVNKVTKKPPKHHTEKTLLRVMETCGKGIEGKEDSEEMMQSILNGFSIGTPATRAETIKKLKDIGYIGTKGKSLICTQLGINIVEIFPVQELLDLEYTGRLESTLSDIEKGKFKKSDFMSLIYDFTNNAVDKIKKDTSALSKFKVELPEGAEEIGKCPVCGNSVIENEKNFGCTNWKNGCKYTIWKDDKYISSFGKKVSKEMVVLLLKNGKVGFRNLKSKKGNTFSAYFRYEKNEKTGYFNWNIEFI